MTKKAELFGVFYGGETEPRALFNNENDAILYDYVRFGDPHDDANIADRMHEVKKVSMSAKAAYVALPFREGVAFNRVMRMRNAMFRGGR